MMIGTLRIGLGVVCLGAFLVAPCFGETASDLNDAGLAHMSAGRFESAAEAFESASALLPDNETIQRNHALALNGWGVSLAQAGKFDDGVAHLLKALKLKPDLAELRRNLAVVRFNAAVKARQDGDHERSNRLLDQAEETAPADELGRIAELRSHNLVALANRERKRDRPSAERKYLLEALDISPVNAVAITRLGEIAYDGGDSAQALKYWLLARRLDPSIEGLDEAIARAGREERVEGDFEERGNRYFEVSYDGDANEAAARKVLEILTKARFDLGAWLNCRPSGRLGVVLYTRDQYSRVTMAPHWSNAGFDGKIRVPIARSALTAADEEKLRGTLYHEYAHALTRDIAGDGAPSWLGEGLATYYELGHYDRNERYEREWGKVKLLADEGSLPRIGGLPQRFTSIADGDRARQAYLISRTFVTWLSKRYRASRFTTVLRSMGEGLDAEQAVRKAFGRDLDKLDSEWRIVLATRGRRD